MEHFKQVNFSKYHHGVPFPNIVPLSAEEMKSLEQLVASGTDKPWLRGVDLACAVASMLEDVPAINAMDRDFFLAKIVDGLCLPVGQCVFLNWRHFDDVDQMAFGDLDRFFSDIWYPSSDDLDIIDSSGRWLISVHHSGTIGWMNL